MDEIKCDFSPMKVEVKSKLLHLRESLESLIKNLDHDAGNCLLNEFHSMKEQVIETESIATTFYLKCYLAPYTAKYDELSHAISHLSKRRHGALLVVQRSDSIDRYITHGVLISAMLTHSLIESIFTPGGPLHDGAVLIQNDKIISAGNVLPLTQRDSEQKKLGTRHRAGLGLSELSDALVIIVSEETGQASFSLEGNLYPFSPGNDLLH
ncbi:sporulation-specific diadenylate cyclase CdaS [Paenibacillus sp. 2TAB26]|uniref:sporulation-specific diadenylate cyclase CdaS n=1 Tax=Paenibacillus sp. 2TAB26 TaxID=3233005 RepID=UPI003F9AF6B2